ncbi:MAG: hypothetical protein GY777_09140 [Candidatus Brocadiaceae bacterium]|nr:hypothetical protein [Candidatus Brocadiaceae bacterium]
MKKLGICILIYVASSLFLFNSIIFAVQVNLTLESYPPATLPVVSKIIDVPDPNDQLEISRQAVLFALSPEGWGLERFGGILQYNEWSNIGSGHLYSAIELTGLNLNDLLGYELNVEAVQYGLSKFGLCFHTDELIINPIHDLSERGESIDNYGVISGSMSGKWLQTPVPKWGEFRVEPIVLIDYSLSLWY